MVSKMDAKLAAGVCLYEKSLDTVKRCIESIKANADYIFAIDGRFTDENGKALFPDRDPLSPQYVRDYLKSIPNVILVDLPSTEIRKRQRYLDMCREYKCDYLLIIDTDEFILPESDWQSFKQNLANCTNGNNIYSIKCLYGYPEHNDTSNSPRLWYKPYDMEYHVAHCLFKNKITGIVKKSSSSGPLIQGIMMAGDDSLRGRDYQIQSFEYQTFLIEDEHDIREEFKNS